MFQVLEKFYSTCQSIIEKKKEEFEGSQDIPEPTTESEKETFHARRHAHLHAHDQAKKSDYKNLFSILLALITIIFLQLTLGKWLWNNYLVNYITIAKPLNSIFDILAISLLIKLIAN